MKNKELNKWYHEYEGEKCSYSCFINRIQLYGRSKEEAILPIYNYMRGNFTGSSSNREKILHKDAIERAYNPDNYKIEITYKPEEAQIIRDEYERMINEIDEQIRLEEYTYERNVLIKLQNQLQGELEIFNSFNP